MSQPCIICVAITGSLPTKENNPAVPISIAEQIESTQEAFEAGASIAHCHVRDGLRVFSLDRMGDVQTLEQAAQETPEQEWAQVLQAGYGIYNGGPVQTAVLLFNADSSRWVRDQTWHPQQQLIAHADGSLELHLPYLDPQELKTEVLSWGPSVKVLSPPELQQQVMQALKSSLDRYR